MNPVNSRFAETELLIVIAGFFLEKRLTPFFISGLILLMNPHAAKLFAAELDQRLPLLDLHLFSPTEAEYELEKFLYAQSQVGVSVVRIVYGIGTGKLKEKILTILQKHPILESVVDEGGSCIIFF